MSENGSEVEKAPDAIPPPIGKRFFLSHCNTYEGLAVYKELWNKEDVDKAWTADEATTASFEE